MRPQAARAIEFARQIAAGHATILRVVFDEQEVPRMNADVTRRFSLAVTVILLLIPCGRVDARSNNNSAFSARQRQEQADALKRSQERKAEFEKKKEEELGLHDWTLTGTLRGTGSTIQFVPDAPGEADKDKPREKVASKDKAKVVTKEKEKVDRPIMTIMLAGKARESVQGLLGDKKLEDLNGKRITLTFRGKAKRSGTSLRFDVMSGGIEEWISATPVN
jgi:hypothetical protein